jgi:hypothetical protein
MFLPIMYCLVKERKNNNYKFACYFQNCRDIDASIDPLVRWTKVAVAQHIHL